MKRVNKLIVILFLHAILFSILSGNDNQLKLKYIKTVKLPEMEIFASDREETLPIILSKLSKDWIAILNKSFRISVFTHSGKIEYRITGTSAQLTFPMEFVGIDNLLLYTIQSETFILWSLKENRPIRKMKMNSDYLYGGASYIEASSEIIAFPRISKKNSKRIILGEAYYFGDDISKLGKPGIKLYPPDGEIDSFRVFNVFGKVLQDGRIYAMQHYDSRLYEYDIDGDLNYIYEPIDGFETEFMTAEISSDFDEGSESWDHFTSVGSLPTMCDSLIIIERNLYTSKRSFDVWNINRRKYLGNINIDKKTFLGAVENTIWILDSLDSDYFYIGQYKLILTSDSIINISSFNVTEPLNEKRLNLAIFLPEYSDTLIIVNTKPDDCLALTYCSSVLDSGNKIGSSKQLIVMYTSEDPEILISLKNTSVDKDTNMILNIDYNLKKELPYVMFLDKRGDIVKELSRSDISHMLKGKTKTIIIEDE